MKADNSRNTFRSDRHYRDVVKQQGRVDVDADWNEQQAINVHRIETEAVDVIGRTGAPLHAAGFSITADGTTLRIGAGRYYVDGILCQNDQDKLDYREQPDRKDAGAVVEELRKADATTGIVYLDVWLRHITALNDPLIREVALGGPDTATRTKVVWQVKVLPVATIRPDRERLARVQAKQVELQTRLQALISNGGDVSSIIQELADVNRELVALRAASTSVPVSCDSQVPAWDRLTAPAAGRLNVRTSLTPPTTDLCQLPPRAGYQRTENQLYRVEVHHGGEIGQATFKWSRDNGTVVTAIDDVAGQDIRVRSIGPDDILGFAENQWVEMVDDASELEGKSGRLLQIEHVPSGSRNVTMKTTPAAVESDLHPALRRWDQSGPSATADGVAITGGWQPLEDGVEVQFSEGPFRMGDYWLIPARTATGEVEWPPFKVPNSEPVAQPPHGIAHHFSRIALVQLDREVVKVTADCRRLFPPLTEMTAPAGQKAMHVKATSWQNDGPIPLTEFLEKGLMIDFDRVPDAVSVSRKTVIVALELPIVPETGFEPRGSNRELAPRLSVVLFGEIMLNENQLRWLPVRSSLQALASFFRGLQHVIGRVTLKGATIWSNEGGTPLYLDGQAVGEPVRSPDTGSFGTGLIFPSGNGKRSSDFESWFVLSLPTAVGGIAIVPQNVRLMQQGNTFVFIAAEGARDPVEVVGTVTLTAAATADVVVAIGASENRELMELPASITIPAGQISARFPIRAVRRPPEGSARIPITANAAGIEFTATLTIVRG